MIKVLQVVPSINRCGGVENYIMNYYRCIDRSKFQFDFVYHIASDVTFAEELESLGANVYKLPEFSIGNLKEIKTNIKRLLRDNKYDIIHCHMANAAFLYFKLAKNNNIKVRVLHSHQSKAADKFLHRIRNYPLLKIGKKRATSYIGCSVLAGDYLFKRNYVVINNAVKVDRFQFNEEKRTLVRKKFAIQNDEVLIGHIGRFCNQKNQSFLIPILKDLNLNEKKYKLILIGGGEQLDEVKHLVDDAGLNDNVIFIGAITDPGEYYNAMDVFVLPSRYEGLPVVGVEAQINGLNVITTNNVTNELNFTGNVKFLSLKDSNDVWEKTIISSLDYNRSRDVNVSKYDILKECSSLEDFYISEYDKYNKK